MPLSRDEFQKALRLGHGRARMHLDAFGLEGLQNIVLEAATTGTTYDPQVDGFAAEWLADFCQSAQIVPTIIGSSPTGAYSNKPWRCALLLQFALRKHPGAREALYEACRETEHGELCGTDELIELDGVDGLAFVATELGQLLLSDPLRKVSDDDFWSFDAQHGEGAALRVLEGLSDTNP